jgi:Protein of unknown function (DUF664)
MTPTWGYYLAIGCEERSERDPLVRVVPFTGEEKASLGHQSLGPREASSGRMVEETARHVGHLDIIRELIDGATGNHQRD